MTQVFIERPRQVGKTVERENAADQALLSALYHAGGEISFIRLYEGSSFTRRELFRAMGRQYALGNIKRHRSGEPLALTASARIAMTAALSSLPGWPLTPPSAPSVPGTLHAMPGTVFLSTDNGAGA